MEGKEYQGITIIREVGPLRLDDRVEQQYQKSVREERLELPAKLETIFSQNERFAKLETPTDVLMLVTLNELKLYTKNSGNKYDLLVTHPVSSSFPTVEIIRKTLSSFLLNVSNEESFRVSVEDNIHRDVAALVVRSFCSRKFVKEEKPASPETAKTEQQEVIESKPQSISAKETTL